MVHTKEDVLRILEEHRVELSMFGVQRIGLFGSFARNEQTADSDVDFLAEYKEGFKNLKNITHPAYLLKEWLGREVDFLTKTPENAYFKQSLTDSIIYVEINKENANSAIVTH